MKLLKSGALASLLIVASVLSGAASAQALPRHAAASENAQSQAAAAHCVVNLDVPEAERTSFCAFGTDSEFATAYFAETGKIIATDGQDARKQLESRNQSGQRVSTAAVTYVVLAVWKDANYKGSKQIFVSSFSDYCASHNYTYDGLVYAFWTIWPDDLNDSIQSLQNGPGCQTWLYTDANRSGSIYKVTASKAASLSWMSDMASSLFITG